MVGRRMANRGAPREKGRDEESSEQDAACNPNARGNDGIRGLKQPAGGSMMEEALAKVSQSA